jgi:hypothetical protein
MQDIRYDPHAADPRPEIVPSLKLIPAADLVEHEGIREALDRYHAARADELAKRRAFEESEAELQAAREADQQALAAAIEAGKADPGGKHERRAADNVDESRRQHGASKLILAARVDDVREAFAAHAEEYGHELEAERDQLREELGQQLDRVETTWHKLQRNSKARSVARGSGAQIAEDFYANTLRVPMVQDGDVVLIGDVLRGLRGIAEPRPENTQAVENIPVGAVPPSNQSGQMLGAQRPAQAVRAWQERDEAEARQSAAALEIWERATERVETRQRRARREADADAVAEVQ